MLSGTLQCVLFVQICLKTNRDLVIGFGTLIQLLFNLLYLVHLNTICLRKFYIYLLLYTDLLKFTIWWHIWGLVLNPFYIGQFIFLSL